MPGFQFRLTTIASAIEWGKRIGFRAAADARKIVFDVLRIEMKVPSRDAIEQWTLWLGASRSELTLETSARFTKTDRVQFLFAMTKLVSASEFSARRL